MPLDPIIAAIVEKMRDAPALSDGTPDQTRALLAAGREALGRGPDMASVRDLEIPGRDGPVRTRIYRPHGEAAGVITFLHGGGWVLGAIEDFDAFARTFAEMTSCVVVLPDYRLAPEYPYPAGLRDSEDVLRWAAKNRRELGADNAPLVIAGDSAGGNLAAVLAGRVHKELELCLQVLFYPVTDCDFTRPSYVAHGDGLPLRSRDMEWFFGHYASREKWTDPSISPLHAEVIDSIAPALVVLAEYDVLRDEGAAYAAKLRDAGVDVTLRECSGFTHGFIRLHNIVPAVRDELAHVGRLVRDALPPAHTL